MWRDLLIFFNGRDYRVNLFIQIIFYVKFKKSRGPVMSELKSNIWFQKTGSGIPLFLIHGGPGMDSSYFSPFLDGSNSFDLLLNFYLNKIQITVHSLNFCRSFFSKI